MQFLLLFAALLVFVTSYHAMWLYFIASIIFILFFMHTNKEVKGKFYALFFYLLCMGIGFLCSRLSEIGIINKNDDGTLMIAIAIFILICSEIINKSILKNVENG